MKKTADEVSIFTLMILLFIELKLQWFVGSQFVKKLLKCKKFCIYIYISKQD